MTLVEEIEALRVKVATLIIQDHGQTSGGNYYREKLKRASVIEGGRRAIITAQTLNQARIINPLKESLK